MIDPTTDPRHRPEGIDLNTAEVLMDQPAGSSRSCASTT